MALTGPRPSTVHACMLVAFIPYGLLLLRDEAPPLRHTLALTVLVALPFLAAPPLSSDDLYRYLWDGRVLGAGMNPYAYAPTDPALAPLRDALWRRINHPELPTIYPPAAQGLFAVADAVAHHPASMKALALLGHLIAVALTGRAAGPRAAVMLALHPLAIEASALGGHVDAFVGAAVLAFAIACRAQRHGLSALSLTFAAGLKLAPALLLPVLGRRHPRAALLAAAGITVVLLPLLMAGGEGATSGAAAYALRWRGHAGAYALLERGARDALEAGFEAPESGRMRVPRAVRALSGTAVDPLAGLVGPKKDRQRPQEVDARVLSEPLARGLVALLLVGGALWAFRRARHAPGDASLTLLLGLLLLTPQLHPWYLLWVLPLAAALGRLGALTWAASLFVAYAPLDGWVRAHVWQEVAWAVGLSHGLALLAIVADARRAAAPRTC